MLKNTDGVSPLKSSELQLYHVWFAILISSVQTRKKYRNLVIGAIFGDSDKPPRNTLPKNVRARLKVRGSAHQISIGGINLQEQKSQLVTIEVSLLTSKSRYFVQVCLNTKFCIYDAIAKAAILLQTQFNE